MESGSSMPLAGFVILLLLLWLNGIFYGFSAAVHNLSENEVEKRAQEGDKKAVLHPTVDYETLALHYHKPEETGIMDTLLTLNAKDKEVLILYYIEGYSCKEIADMLKVSESAVKKKLERARKRLKEKYESEGR